MIEIPAIMFIIMVKLVAMAVCFSLMVYWGGKLVKSTKDLDMEAFIWLSLMTLFFLLCFFATLKVVIGA